VGGSRLLRAGGTVDEAGARGQAWGATTEAREVQRRLRAAPSELCEAVGGQQLECGGAFGELERLSSRNRNRVPKTVKQLPEPDGQG
jgi:hypothetical protein